MHLGLISESVRGLGRERAGVVRRCCWEAASRKKRIEELLQDESAFHSTMRARFFDFTAPGASKVIPANEHARDGMRTKELARQAENATFLLYLSRRSN